MTVELWRDAGFSHGQELLDLGCGPGFATLDLAHLVGSSGRVDAVDSSEHFLQVVRQQSQAHGLAHVTTHLGDVHALELPDSSVDGVFARWLLCFVADPQQVVAEAHRVLRPGKPLVLLDYFNYRAVQMFPPRASFRALFEAYYASATSHGGSYDIGNQLPAMLDAQGFTMSTIKPICRIANPGSRLWRWVELFNRNYVPKLVEQGLMTSEARTQLETDWQEASHSRTAFLFTPPMLGIGAHKAI